jgi:hypothetical protein
MKDKISLDPFAKEDLVDLEQIVECPAKNEKKNMKDIRQYWNSNQSIPDFKTFA